MEGGAAARTGGERLDHAGPARAEVPEHVLRRAGRAAAVHVPGAGARAGGRARVRVLGGRRGEGGWGSWSLRTARLRERPGFLDEAGGRGRGGPGRGF